MEDNNNIEKAYELIEQFEYAELSDANKLYVLSVMTETKYTEMRNTVKEVKILLDNDIEPCSIIQAVQNKTGGNKLLRFMNYKVKLYQVAASIAILITINFVIQKSRHDLIKPLIARHDSIYIHKTDTVYEMVYDTVKIIESKVQSIKVNLSKNENKGLTLANKTHDCSQELCPSEVGRIITMNNKNNISNDTTLKGLLASLK